MTLVPLVLIMLMAGPSRFRQEPSSGTRLIVSTQQELQDAVGSESEAARIIKEILAGRLKTEVVRADARPLSVNVVAEQLPETWLPVVDGVRIQRVALAEARSGWEQGCLSLLRVSVSNTDTTLTVTVTDGHRCTSISGDYLFDRRADGWVAGSGLGGGIVSGLIHCPCKTIR